MTTDPIYPIGKFQTPDQYSQDNITLWIEDIEKMYPKLFSLVAELNHLQLQKSYKPNGWTIAQIVHHLADSHLNAYLRMKLALENTAPTINAYDENQWADLEDGKSLEVAPSLSIIKGLHQRWAQFLKNLSEEEFEYAYFHPEHQKSISILEALPSYSWHCKHHVGQIKNAIENPQ